MQVLWPEWEQPRLVSLQTWYRRLHKKEQEQEWLIMHTRVPSWYVSTGKP